MSKNQVINIEAFHIQVKNGSLVIFGSRPKGDKNKITEIRIVDVDSKTWILEATAKECKKHLKRLVYRLTEKINNITTA